MNTPAVNELRKRGRRSVYAAATSEVMPLDPLRLSKKRAVLPFVHAHKMGVCPSRQDNCGSNLDLIN